jgi:hypothetical protein
MSPALIEMMKAEDPHVEPGAPETLPFLTALEAFLGRWFGVGFEAVTGFRHTSFAVQSPRSKSKPTVEVEIESPNWYWDVSFDNFTVEGHLVVQIPQDVMEASRCFRLWKEEDAKHEHEMDLTFWVKPGEDGGYKDEVWLVRADRQGVGIDLSGACAAETMEGARVSAQTQVQP